MKSSYTLRIPEELRERIKEEAERSDMSVNQYILYTLTKEIAYKEAALALKEKIKKAPTRKEALKLLESKVPDVPPLEDDKLPLSGTDHPLCLAGTAVGSWGRSKGNWKIGVTIHKRHSPAALETTESLNLGLTMFDPDAQSSLQDRGSSLSPLLGDFYLLDLDRRMKKMDVRYFRFVDDILILGATRWKLKKAIRALNETLHELGLERQLRNTCIGRTEMGLGSRRLKRPYRSSFVVRSGFMSRSVF
jgi:hypothetical protein